MTSAITVFANIVLFVYIAMQFADKAVDGTLQPACYLGLSTGSVAMMSAMMQTVVIQMCVLPMYAEMRDRSPARFNDVIAVSFCVLFLICSGFSVLGYLTFGNRVSSNVLVDFPKTLGGTLSRLAAASAVVGVYPVILGPMIAAIHSLFEHSGPVAGALIGNSKTTLLICTVVFAVMCAAMYMRDLGFLNVVSGALSLGCFVAVVPCLVGLHLLGPKSQAPLWRSAMYTLAGVGCCLSLLGLVLTDNYEALLQAACHWTAFPH